jgi:nickel transport protein
MKRTIVLALFLTLFSATTLYAHYAWVVKEGDILVVKYGHGDKIDPYKPAYVTAAKAYNASGKEIGVTIKPQETRAVLVPGQAPALVSITYNSGAWVKTPEGWKNISKPEAKKEGKTVLQSDKSLKYSKAIWQWNPRFSKPLGVKMELVPLKNPLVLKVGDKLPLQILYNGKPLAGIEVRGEGAKDGPKTDQKGLVEVPITKSGLNVLAATNKTPTPKDPDADMLVEVGNLSFEVK